MSAEASPRLAVRPMLPSEGQVLAAIFRDSILELTGDDYTEMQQEAWAAAAADESAFARRLAGELTIVATLAGSPVGFASLEADDKIGFCYVHPAAVGQGVGAALANALEKLAAARGVEMLSVDASDSAREFFAKRGYVAEQRNSVRCGDQWLANTTMRKDLATAAASGAER
jgi:putative acetyltransferase